MTSLRTFLVAGSLMLLGVSTLSAQAGRVTCMDGSASAGGRGACSGHGGIMTPAMKAKIAADARAAKKAEKVAAAKMAKADVKSGRDDEHEARGATAECKDHTYSHAASHQGACSRHGGVTRFMDGKK